MLIKPFAPFVLIALLLNACSQSSPAVPDATAPTTAAPAVPTAAPPPTVAAPQPATRLAMRQLGKPGGVYGLTELEVETDGVVDNRFDPAQFDLSVRFTAPSGASVLVPAFSYQDFDPNSLRPLGEPAWRVRFTPSEPGEWQAQAELASPQLRSEPLGLTIAPDPAARGFVRLNPQNLRYYAFDNGDFYFPIGPNLGWATQSGLGVLKDYERWLDRLSQNGGNVGRVWMASWSFAIEWNDTGLGDYSGRMQQAWLLDQVFRLAEQRGVYLMLTLLNHGAFSDSVNPEWDSNPTTPRTAGRSRPRASSAATRRPRRSSSSACAISPRAGPIRQTCSPGSGGTRSTGRRSTTPRLSRGSPRWMCISSSTTPTSTW